MAKNKKTTDDLQTVAPARTAEVPADVLGGRLDYGDAAQRAEMDGLDEFGLDEPIEMVDAPVQLREPMTRAQKRRNQRRSASRP